MIPYDASFASKWNPLGVMQYPFSKIGIFIIGYYLTIIIFYLNQIIFQIMDTKKMLCKTRILAQNVTIFTDRYVVRNVYLNYYLKR